MEYRQLQHSELTLSAIAFGAWAAGGWMWGQTDRHEAIKAMRAAYAEGMTSFDTAPIYGQGESEEIVGEALQDIPRDKVQILTKFGLRWDLNKGNFYVHSQNNQGKDIDIYKYARKESIIQECENSLKRLKTDYIDLYQIHWADITTPISETFEAVARLIEQGKIRYAGVCNYTPEQIEEADKAVNIISDQIPFSMVNRGSEDKIIPFCIRNEKSVIAYSPMERGLLTGKMTPGQNFKKGDHRKTNPYFTDDSIIRTNAFLAKIKPSADEKGITLSQLVLRWTIDHPGITIALAGARNKEQAISNARAADVHLSNDEILFINKQLEFL